MANPDPACIVYKLSLSSYSSFFEQVFGAGSLEITWPSDVPSICIPPTGAAVLKGNPTPVNLSTSDRTLANKDFDEFAQAIAAYESSDSVSPFTSKFDYYLAGKTTLTTQEQNGYDLFRGTEAAIPVTWMEGQARSRAEPIPARQQTFSLCSPTPRTTILAFPRM